MIGSHLLIVLSHISLFTDDISDITPSAQHVTSPIIPIPLYHHYALPSLYPYPYPTIPSPTSRQSRKSLFYSFPLIHLHPDQTRLRTLFSYIHSFLCYLNCNIFSFSISCLFIFVPYPVSLAVLPLSLHSLALLKHHSIALVVAPSHKSPIPNSNHSAPVARDNRNSKFTFLPLLQPPHLGGFCPSPRCVPTTLFLTLTTRCLLKNAFQKRVFSNYLTFPRERRTQMTLQLIYP